MAADPFRVLPDSMRRHQAVPLYVLAVWAALVAGFALYVASTPKSQRPRRERAAPYHPVVADVGAAMTPEAAASPEALAHDPTAAPVEAAAFVGPRAGAWAGLALTVHGRSRFDVEHKGGVLRTRGDRLPAGVLSVGPSGELRLTPDAGGGAYVLRRDDTGDAARLYAPDGHLAYRVVVRDEESRLRIQDGVGAELLRLKVKRDHFNVYRGSGVHLGTGKVEGAGIVLRDDADDHRMAFVTGAASLDEAALVTLPLEPAYAVLLWFAFAE